MNLKDMVDRINGSPTMLVKVKFGVRDAPDTVIAKPATYDEEKDAAIATPRPLSFRTRALHVPRESMTQSNGFHNSHAMTYYPSAGSI